MLRRETRAGSSEGCCAADVDGLLQGNAWLVRLPAYWAGCAVSASCFVARSAATSLESGGGSAVFAALSVFLARVCGRPLGVWRSLSWRVREARGGARRGGRGGRLRPGRVGRWRRWPPTVRSSRAESGVAGLLVEADGMQDVGPDAGDGGDADQRRDVEAGGQGCGAQDEQGADADGDEPVDDEREGVGEQPGGCGWRRPSAAGRRRRARRRQRPAGRRRCGSLRRRRGSGWGGVVGEGKGGTPGVGDGRADWCGRRGVR